MKRDEFLLGLCAYALIIAMGYAGSLLVKLKSLPWNLPGSEFRADIYGGSAGKGKEEASALFPGKSKLSLRRVPVLEDPLEASEEARIKEWIRMAHPEGGQEENPGLQPAPQASNKVRKEDPLNVQERIKKKIPDEPVEN